LKKYINQADMKQANFADVLALIKKAKKITRKEIEAKTGFSWGAVSTITSRLLQEKYIVEYKCKSPNSTGRTPGYLQINGDDYLVLGIDINISGFTASLINLKGEVIITDSHKTSYGDKESLLREIFGFVRSSLMLAKTETVIGIGIAMQGTVDSKNGISASIPHCKEWLNIPLAQIISEEFGIPTFIEHDPDCILYDISAEQTYKNAVLLRIDNGIGMSVMINGKVIKKPGMYEIGHSVVVPGGALCSCGKNGCLEAYASITGVSQLAQSDFEEIVQKASSGDKKCLALFDDMAKYLSMAIYNTLHLICISDIVMCGNMCKYHKLFYDRLLEHLNIIDKNHNLKFIFSDLENASKGAALMALDQLFEHIDFCKGDVH